MLGLLRDEPKVRREVPERVLGLADNDEAAPAVGRRLTIEGRGTRLGATLVVAGTGRPERGAAAGAEEGLRDGAARVTDGARAGAERVTGEGLEARPGRRLTFEGLETTRLGAERVTGAGLDTRLGAERLPPEVERVKDRELAELLLENEDDDVRRASALYETANVSEMIAIEKNLLFFMACSFSR